MSIAKILTSLIPPPLSLLLPIFPSYYSCLALHTYPTLIQKYSPPPHTYTYIHIYKNGQETTFRKC